MPLILLASAALLAAAPPPAYPVVNITASDYGLEMPASVPAGLVEVRLRNAGKELHHALLIRLDGVHTARELVAQLKPGAPLPSWAHPVGGPNAAGPTQEISTVLRLEPGNYVALCVIPSPDGKPHFAKGMQRGFVVASGMGRQPAEPVADVTLTLTDYAFTFSKPITPGKHTIKIVNAAAQPHEAVLMELVPGKTPADFLKWAEKPDGPPPIKRAMSGAGDMANGGTSWVTETFTPGDYMLVCFVADSKDGKPHFVHGMVKQFRVG